MIDESQYDAHLMFSVAHEICHILIRRGDYYKLIRKHHASVSNMKRHIELIVNHGAARFMITAEDIREASELFGEDLRAILHLMKLSGASEGASMWRWAEQDFDERRGAFIPESRYITRTATCGLYLPFKRWDRVPEAVIQHPEVAAMRLTDGRIMGTIAVWEGA